MFVMVMNFFILGIEALQFRGDIEEHQTDSDIKPAAGGLNPSDYILKRYFISPEKMSNISKYFLYMDFDNSICPDETWLKDMRYYDPSIRKVIVNVGYKKGYNYAKYASVWCPSSNITLQSWHNGLIYAYNSIRQQQYAPSALDKESQQEFRLCGACNECLKMYVNEPQPSGHSKMKMFISAENAANKMVFYGFDINKRNADRINLVLDYHTLSLSDQYYYQDINPNYYGNFISIYNYVAQISNKSSDVYTYIKTPSNQHQDDDDNDIYDDMKQQEYDENHKSPSDNPTKMPSIIDHYTNGYVGHLDPEIETSFMLKEKDSDVMDQNERLESNIVQTKYLDGFVPNIKPQIHSVEDNVPEYSLDMLVRYSLLTYQIRKQRKSLTNNMRGSS